ncbi:hypothetical protein PR048_019010 [Dryococelus australis]|uniref:Zinc finger PHD-type domain-containing protein n=1 Tax=Dryococelus australis TaxID=614101 RepID=A0ABQ9H2A0_9NEOP|nr:hypothetical protein PR048_019010 [Dryococelus australis]
MERKLGNSWTQEVLTKAMDSVLKDKVSVRCSAITHGIPRRTLRNHLLSGSRQKIKGMKPIPFIDLELGLCNRILRYSDIGMPLTPNVLKRTVFSFCELNGLKHPFNPNTASAGKQWLELFLRRQPNVSRTKSQNLNPARAQELNRFIVNGHFEKLITVMPEIGVMEKSQSIYNIDEKGNRLCLHKAQTVLAKEELEGIRLKPKWTENLPTGTQVFMTAKGSMTSQTFVKWFDHFAKYKTPGPVLLIFDGASSHLDANIVHAAEAQEIILYCLPSNTDHELQPLDKRHINHTNMEDVSADRVIKGYQFGRIFSRAWVKAVTLSNICSDFRATGIYPFDPTAIPDEAFAPSVLTFQLHRQAGDSTNNGNEESHSLQPPDNTATLTCEVIPDVTTMKKSTTTGSKDTKIGMKNENVMREKTVTKKKAVMNKNQTKTNEKIIDNIGKNTESKGKKTEYISSRSKYISSRASTSRKDPSRQEPRTSSQMAKQREESWYCHICKTDRVEDMRLCNLCLRYVHEACEGLTRTDSIPNFRCMFCKDSH